MLEHLRQVIGLRGYGQRDPLNEYKAEAFKLFETMSQQPARGGHRAADAGRDRAAAAGRQRAAQLPLHGGPQGRSGRPARTSWRWPQAGAATLARAGITPKPRGRAQSERSVDLGQGRPQRGMPLRLRQEVQALPRPVRLGASRLPNENAGPRPGVFVSVWREIGLAEARPAVVEIAASERPARRRSWPYRRRRAGHEPARSCGAWCRSAVPAGAAAVGSRSSRLGGLDWLGVGRGFGRIAPCEATRVGLAAGLAFGAAAASRWCPCRCRAGRPAAPCDRTGRRSFGWLLVGRLRREQAAEQAAAARLRGRLGLGDRHLGGETASEAGGAAAARAPAARRPARDCAAAGREPESCRAASRRTVASCGARRSGSSSPPRRRLGFMPPSALVLTGAVAILRRAQIGELRFVLAALCPAPALAISSGTSIRRALAAGAERQRACAVRRLGVEHVVLLADIDLGLEAGHLEMVVALLEHLPERDVRVVAMARPCSAPSCGTDRPAPGTISGRRRRRRGRARRSPQSARRSSNSSRATSSRRAP